MRFATYNIYGLRCLYKRPYDDLVQALKDLRCDFLAMQEIDSFPLKKLHNKTSHDFAQDLNMHCAFHKTRDSNDGHAFGNAVFCKSQPVHIYQTALPRLSGRIFKEERGLIAFEVDWKSNELVIVNTHLSLLKSERDLQIQFLNQYLDKLFHVAHKKYIILCGDLNLGWTSQHRRSFPRFLKHANPSRPIFTWPTMLPPFRQLDHIFHSERIHLDYVHTADRCEYKVFSDHLPLLSELTWEP